MKKRISAIAIAVVMIATLLTACGKTTSPSVETDAFLKELNATYEELFPVLNNEDYEDYWVEKVTTFVGEENAEAYTEGLKSACTGTIYGTEAAAAFSDLESAQFNCYFINGVDEITINNNNISGTLDGKEVFSHTYSYQEDNAMSGMMDVRVYKADDENAGEFTYFLFCPDTPGTTYHIEFRYGSDLDALLELMDGDYAFWLAAGIPVNSEPDFVKACIDLFVEENMESDETDFDVASLVIATNANEAGLMFMATPDIALFDEEIKNAHNNGFTWNYEYAEPNGSYSKLISGMSMQLGAEGSGFELNLNTTASEDDVLRPAIGIGAPFYFTAAADNLGQSTYDALLAMCERHTAVDGWLAFEGSMLTDVGIHVYTMYNNEPQDITDRLSYGLNLAEVDSGKIMIVYGAVFVDRDISDFSAEGFSLVVSDAEEVIWSDGAEDGKITAVCWIGMPE